MYRKRIKTGIFLGLLCSAFIASPSYATTRIAIIDTGFNLTELEPRLCPSGHYDFLNKKPIVGLDNNPSHHGTNVHRIISKYAGNKDYCFLIYKVFGFVGSDSFKYIPKAIRMAVDNHASVINLSMTGQDPVNKEASAIKYAIKHKVKVFVAAGNERLDLDVQCKSYPACYKYPDMIVVGNKNTSSNKGSVVNSIEAFCDEGFCGTSASTPIAVGKYVKGLK